MKFFFINITATLIVADLFLWWRGARALRAASLGIRLGYHLFLALQVALISAIFVARSTGFALDPWVPTPVFTSVFIWHLLILPVAFVASLLGLTTSGIAAIVRWSMRGKTKAQQVTEPETSRSEQKEGAKVTPLLRRQFLGRAAVLTPPLLNLTLSAVATAQIERFRIRRFTITLPQLPPALDGLTIAHLSDTHVGRFTHGDVLQRIAAATNELDPDLVLFTGDLINDSLFWLPKATEMLQAIKKPVYLCEGNHDLIDNKATFHRVLSETSGVHLLVDKSITIPLRGEKVQIFGSRWSRVEDPAITKALLRKRDPSATFAIHLAHHPHLWDHDVDGPDNRHVVPLTLAGHTHGGQIMVNEHRGFGSMMYHYWTGLYQRGKGRAAQALVVSNGVGNWFPLRVQAPAEIVHLTLKRGEAELPTL